MWTPPLGDPPGHINAVKFRQKFTISGAKVYVTRPAYAWSLLREKPLGDSRSLRDRQFFQELAFS